MESRHFWLLNLICCTALLICSINASTTRMPTTTTDFDHNINLIEDEHDIKLQHIKNDKLSKVSETKYNKMLTFPKFDNSNNNNIIYNKINNNNNNDDDDDTKDKILLKKLNSLDPNLKKMLQDPQSDKSSISKKNDEFKIKKPEIVIKKTTTKKPVTEMKKIPLADDPRFNKMLPEKNILKDKDNTNKDSTKKDSEYEYDYNEDYDNYYDQLYDESSAENKHNKTTVTVTHKPKKEIKLKPIKGDDKEIPKKDTDKDDYEFSDYNDFPGDKEEVISKNSACPKDCICNRNYNSVRVATCSRLDSNVQKFGSDITDLVVVDVGPKYPIALGASFFTNIGLKNLNSLKISNCTIEFLHPTAFHGLTELFAVNLTNVGIQHIDPDTFATNKRLRLLAISGNDLSSMTSPQTKTKYIIKSSSVEELDLSNNKFKEIQSEAFIHLPNIVYINLAGNDIRTLPKDLFKNVVTIEELDLSRNKITYLPTNIFNRTALARLDLKYNDITGGLGFGTSDLQQLDLSYCSIKVIHNHMFNKMTGLLTLNLRGNGIIKIQPDSFTSLNYLRHIDLSYNNLEQLSSMLFYKNPNLDVIRLNDNAKLSVLPPDGFQSLTNVFAVYLLDISNCAINSLGKNTFSQMPFITTLKLSWNNINNMHKDAFLNLKQLNELDLGNNLIVKLDENIFKENKQLSKLILSGNPITSISTKLFQYNTKLHELDISDCELQNVLEDYYYYDNEDNVPTAFFDTLRVFNVSFNKIRKISKKHVQLFKNLKTFSIEGNLLKCNNDFKELIKYLVQKNINSGRVLEKSVLEISSFYLARTVQGAAHAWDDVVNTVCKRENEKRILKNKPIRFDSDIDEDQDDEENNKDETLSIKKIVLPTFEQEKKILDGLKEEENSDGKNGGKDKNTAAEEKESDEDDDYDDDDDNDEEYDDENDNDKNGNDKNDDDNNENDDNSKEENDDDEDEDEYNDEEYDYKEENKKTKEKEKPKEILIETKPQIKNHGVFANEVNIIKETGDKFLRGRLLENDDDIKDDNYDDDDDDEEIIIEHGRIYYENNKILKPIAIGLLIMLIISIVLAVAKLISNIRRRRGERYRMAIQASKNSIVYQKLSEEIPKTINKNPKVHRYSRINQV